MIDILLATYNGEKYLRQQLDSIFSQSYQEWKLLVRDDGSNDNTISIIEDYIAQHPGRIRLVVDEKGRLGPGLNFGELLKYSTLEYVMFSDQDDVWLPNKIDVMLELMKHAESMYPNKPVLVHTDLRVVDVELNLIAESLWDSGKICPTMGDDLCKVMVEPFIHGCAMMINRQAKAISTPILKEATCHDWWIAIHVAKHGRIVYCSLPCILHRQHGKSWNETTKRDFLHYVRKILGLSFVKKVRYYRRVGRMIRSTGYRVPTRRLVKKRIISILVKILQTL